MTTYHCALWQSNELLSCHHMWNMKSKSSSTSLIPLLPYGYLSTNTTQRAMQTCIILTSAGLSIDKRSLISFYLPEAAITVNWYDDNSEVGRVGPAIADISSV